MTQTENLRFKLSRIFAPITIDRCIVEGNLVTLRILHDLYEDDRNNIIDVEGIEVAELVEVIDHKAALEQDNDYYLILHSISTILKIELL